MLWGVGVRQGDQDHHGHRRKETGGWRGRPQWVADTPLKKALTQPMAHGPPRPNLFLQ